jgi:hypothetical protein
MSRKKIEVPAADSKGHLCWSYCPDTGLVTEWFDRDGEVFRASSSNVIELGTGYRFGRWEGSRRHFEQAIRPGLKTCWRAAE